MAEKTVAEFPSWRWQDIFPGMATGMGLVFFFGLEMFIYPISSDNMSWYSARFHLLRTPCLLPTTGALNNVLKLHFVSFRHSAPSPFSD